MKDENITPERKELLTKAFHAAGYAFDEIDSYDGYLVFSGEGGEKYTFQSWTEAGEWINGVIFDEPERNDAVERVLHPERFMDHEENTAEHQEITEEARELERKAVEETSYPEAQNSL